MPETCPTHDAGTISMALVSESRRPVAPLVRILCIHGQDGCNGREMLAKPRLIYRYKLEFAELTQVTSIAVSGAVSMDR